MKFKIEIQYTTSDGKKFPSKEEAEAHEEELRIEHVQDILSCTRNAAMYLLHLIDSGAEESSLGDKETVRVWEIRSPRLFDDFYRDTSVQLGPIVEATGFDVLQYATGLHDFRKQDTWGTIREVTLMRLGKTNA
jgi:hypothetical protein